MNFTLASVTKGEEDEPASRESGQLAASSPPAADNSSSSISSSDLFWKERVQVSPDWTQLGDQLTWTWHLHVYGLASLFLLLCCIAFFSVLGLRAQLSSRPHLTSLNVFLCLLGISRSLGLFIDPYGSKNLIPQVMRTILWDLAFPCLLSAFALLQLAFVRMTQIKVAPSKMSGETCVTLIITSHFCLTMAADILWSLQNSMRVVRIVTQVLFAAWGLFLCLSFLCGCLRLQRSLAKLPLVFLSRSESSSYENKGVLHLGTLSRHSIASTTNGPSNHRNSSAPRIRITDENDHSFSYVSDTSQPNITDGGVASTPNSPGPRSPLTPPNDRNDGANAATRTPSTQRWRRSSGGSTRSGPPNRVEESAQREPLMVRTVHRHSRSLLRGDLTGKHSRSKPSDRGTSGASSETKHHAEDEDGERGPMLPSAKAPDGSVPSKVNTPNGKHMNHESALQDFQFDAHKLKPSRRSRVEKLLRRMATAAILGILVCMLQVYGVFGPHGLSSAYPKAAALPWFCYQTIYRLVEFTMGCTMASITKQTLHNHYCHSHGLGFKHRETLFT